MVNFAIACNLGIGDLIVLHNILENEKHKFDKILISPRWNLFDIYGMKQNIDFTKNFIYLLFTDPKYEIVNDPAAPALTVVDLVESYHMKLSKLSLEGKLCAHTVPKDFCDEIDSWGPYVVVTTKFRGYNRSDWEQIKDQFIEALKTIGCKVVVIGERNLMSDPLLGARLGSDQPLLTNGTIYNDIKGKLEFVDKTFEHSNEPFTIGKVIDDCIIMNGAKAVVNIGYGGNFLMAVAVAKKTINLSAPHPLMKYYMSSDDHIVFGRENQNGFIEKIRKLKEE